MPVVGGAGSKVFSQIAQLNEKAKDIQRKTSKRIQERKEKEKEIIYGRDRYIE